MVGSLFPYHLLTITKIASDIVVQFSETVYPQLLDKQLLWLVSDNCQLILTRHSCKTGFSLVYFLIVSKIYLYMQFFVVGCCFYIKLLMPDVFFRGWRKDWLIGNLNCYGLLLKDECMNTSDFNIFSVPLVSKELVFTKMVLFRCVLIPECTLVHLQWNNLLQQKER